MCSNSNLFGCYFAIAHGDHAKGPGEKNHHPDDARKRNRKFTYLNYKLRHYGFIFIKDNNMYF